MIVLGIDVGGTHTDAALMDDGPFVECCRNLPPAVRVWALLASEGDTVRLMPPTRQRPTTKESDKYAAGLRPKDL